MSIESPMPLYTRDLHTIVATVAVPALPSIGPPNSQADRYPTVIVLGPNPLRFFEWDFIQQKYVEARGFVLQRELGGFAPLREIGERR